MRRILVIAALLIVGCSGDKNGTDNNTVSNNANNENNQNNINNENNVNNQTTGPNNFIPPDGFAIDLVADTNRDGVVDPTDVTDDMNEDVWSDTQGAIFLANLDDDSGLCSRGGSDETLAACFDAADEAVNGESDLLDMARIELVGYNVPDDATATIRVSLNADRVRLFRQRGDDFDVVTDGLSLEAPDLKSGVVFFLEGKDIVRDSSWDGFTEIEVESSSSEGESSDKVQLRVAPLLFAHHLLPPHTAYASERAAGGDGAFSRDLEAAIEAADFGQPLYDINQQDQWTQDYFEPGYMTMPAEGGAHVMDVFVRSANIQYDRQGRPILRIAGQVVYTEFRGVDVAGLTEVDWNHDPFWDTLNSFGNAETIPPHEGFPVGRILRGKANGLAGDDRMYGLMEAQRVQEPVYIDTGWLLVGHVDETVSFIKDNNADTWKMVYNDPRMARDMLQQAVDDGFGGTVLHSGRNWIDWRTFREVPATVSIDQLLNDANVMAASAEAIAEVDEQIDIIKRSTGLSDDRLLAVPFLHESQSGLSVAYQPGVVNGISLGDTHFAAPEMHGPIVNGNDIFANVVEESFSAAGVTVHWIEDWDMFHRLSGEVHCGTNTRRIPVDDWWVSPRGGSN